ncbi:ABC-type multidrug transport system, ATPase component [Halobacteroides halobius DSM 5150]|uniref:ABC-type multidrug transport system, ATPase component n=1 Tax=Halobacteroides halobius (strain ATCC 35273 / DSM 5150 / MD-1) TaxID=748449 RepID=L0KAW7_HALHC|nr:ABC transporter ATP-binding protein [Halobacteroides halobius]AGB42437.1 ABC-type multidrug transport system, ATPase component [Halobacteroides halobius DSM 5150]
MSTAIEFKGINKSYGDLQALNDINLTIKKGEFFGLLGPNGAGKSTLIGTLAGLVNMDSGSVTVLGQDIITNYLQTKQQLGIVPQEVSFDPFFTVRETLEIQSGYFGISNNQQKIDEILGALDLKDKEDIKPRGLSGGMKRRLLIAKALVHDPEIIVLDEPTAGVDVELRRSLWEYVTKLNQEGKTIILTTHYLEEAEALCDRIAILDQGEVIAIDSKENLINLIDKKIIKVKFAETNDLIEKLPKYNAKLNDGELELEITKDEVAKLLSWLDSLELEIEDIEIASAKLEDVFVQLTNLGGDSDE